MTEINTQLSKIILSIKTSLANLRTQTNQLDLKKCIFVVVVVYKKLTQLPKIDTAQSERIEMDSPRK